MVSAKSSEHTLPGGEGQNSTPDSADERKEENLNQEANTIKQGLEDDNPEVEKQSITEVDQKTEPLDEANDEYPSGRHLVPIIGSLIMVVFLVSLDMVSGNSFSTLEKH